MVTVKLVRKHILVNPTNLTTIMFVTTSHKDLY